MSELHREHDEEAHQVFKVPGEQDVCFHCGEPMIYPSIYWAGLSGREGWNGRIYFHPACAVSWVMAFVRDILELNAVWDVKDKKPPRL